MPTLPSSTSPNTTAGYHYLSAYKENPEIPEGSRRECGNQQETLVSEPTLAFLGQERGPMGPEFSGRRQHLQRQPYNLPNETGKRSHHLRSPGCNIVIQSLSCDRLFATPWTAPHQASLSFTISRSLLKLMSIESVIQSNHLILCQPPLLLPSIFPSISLFQQVIDR